MHGGTGPLSPRGRALVHSVVPSRGTEVPSTSLLSSALLVFHCWFARVLPEVVAFPLASKSNLQTPNSKLRCIFRLLT